MKKWWWKFLGVLLFIYVLIGGMITPLNTGITSVSPLTIKAGAKQKVILSGYNTHYLQSENFIWLKQDDNHFIKATEVKAINENTLEASFDVPNNAAQKGFTIITYNKMDGRGILPDGIFVGNADSTANSLAQFLPAIDFELTQTSGIRFPYRSILNETIRNTFFHVALWMAMFVIYVIGLVYAVLYLITKNMDYDTRSSALNKSGILYGILGILTGSLWAKYTWGDWWTNDVKLNMATIAMFIYFGYLILRSSIADIDKRARISAVFSIFAFVALIPLVFVIPRLTDSLHPGNGGNPALGGEDLDNTLRLFFYPSIIALILLGVWMAQLKYRQEKIEYHFNSK